MFAGAYFEGTAGAAREGLLQVIEERLRGELYRDGAWWADYRRLRVDAVMVRPASSAVTDAMDRVGAEVGNAKADAFVSSAARRTLERSED